MENYIVESLYANYTDTNSFRKKKLGEAKSASSSRYSVIGCNHLGRVEDYKKFLIVDSLENDRISYPTLCEIIRDVNEDSDLSSSDVDAIAEDIISELYFENPSEDISDIVLMYSY